MSSKATVFGIVSTQEEADAVIVELHAAGFPLEDVSVLVADPGGVRSVEDASRADHSRVAEGMGSGGLLGGGVGLLVGMGALAIPGLGPFIVAGPLFAAFSSAAVGAAVGAALGTLTGALIGAGVPESDAQLLESRIWEGAIMIAIETLEGDQMWRAKDLLMVHGARDIMVSSGTPAFS